jgi:hypothetical protein
MSGDDDKTKDTSLEPTLAELAKIMRETCSAVKDLSARIQALEVAAQATTVALPAGFSYRLPGYGGIPPTSAPSTTTPQTTSALLTAYAAVSLPASQAPAAWPPSLTVWTEGANSMRGSVSTRVSTRAAATGVVPAPTTGAVVLQHPFVDGIFYKGTDVQQVWVSAVVRLQATAHGLLAWWRLQQIEQVAAVRLQAVARSLLARRQQQEVRRQMRNQEATLAAVAFNAQGQDLDPFDGLQ